MTIPFGALATFAAQARGANLQGQNEGRQQAVQRALLINQAEERQRQLALQTAIANMRQQNYDSLERHRVAQEEADPITHTDYLQNGNVMRTRKSGANEVVDGNGNLIAKNGKPVDQSQQEAAPPPSGGTNFNSSLVGALRKAQGLQPQPQDQEAPTPTLTRQLPPTAQAPTPAPAFGKPQVIPPSQGNLTSKPMNVNGKDILGFVDKHGNYYDEHSQPLPKNAVVKPVVQQPNNVFLPSVDPNTGQTVYSVGKNKGNPDITPTDVQKPETAGAGGARSATQMQTAYNQAVQAHKDMAVFEQHLKDGSEQISSADATLAQRAFGGGIDASLAMGLLNQKHPSLARYVRGAKAIGTAERLIVPKGGSNYLTQTETALSAVGPGLSPGPDMDAQVDQATGYRDALVRGLASHLPQTTAPTTTKAVPSPAPASQGTSVIVNGKKFVIHE